jgi:hypothetical protein
VRFAILSAMRDITPLGRYAGRIDPHVAISGLFPQNHSRENENGFFIEQQIPESNRCLKNDNNG